MKFKLSPYTAMLFILFIFSCKKDKVITPTYPVSGLWIGTYTSDQQPAAGAQYFSFVIKPDGTIIFDAKASTNQYIALGTWNLTGTAFTSAYTNIWSTLGPTGVSQTAKATFDNTGKLTGGTWSNAGGGATGTFTLNRVN